MKRSWRTLNGLDILTLRLLVVAGEEGNLARVSERENIAISAVSRRISDFEQRNGVQIFERHDRGVSLTYGALDARAGLDTAAHRAVQDAQ